MNSMNRMKSTTYLCGILAFFLPVTLGGPAFAGPEDGVITSGAATISQAGNRTDVYQSSQRVLIDWRNFDTKADEIAQFHQPSSSSIAVNRVNSAAGTQFDGSLIANGNIVIINQNGIAFGKNSNVDVNGLVATTSTLNENDFINNSKLRFSESGNSQAKVVNEGTITARDAGLIGLVAPQVENHGVINARLGKVHLASGDQFSVDFYGAGLMGIAVSDNVSASLVKNTGAITAEGGEIQITAAAGKAIVDSLIEIEGELSAPTFSQKNGRIIIGAKGANKTDKKGHSTVKISAKIDVSGQSDTETGGYVEITGDNIALTENIEIDASGVAGGGEVLIGGDYQGQGLIDTAIQTRIEEGAVINVSALQNGDGGKAIVWADDHTQFDGDIVAKGGASNGDGGFIETSGKNTLGVSGRVDASAENGQNGTWLLDPNNITIQDAGLDSDITQAPVGTFTSDNDSAIVTTASIETALASTNVIIQTASNNTNAQDGDITVADQLDWTSANNLTLDADNDININATITNTGTGGLTLNAGLDGAGNIDINNEISIGNDFNATSTGDTTFIGADILTNGGNINLNSATTLTDANRLLDADTGTVFVSSNGVDADGFNVVLSGNDFDINGVVDTGGSRSVTFRANTTFGIGTGASGSALIDDAEIALLADSGSRIAFSTDDGTAGSGFDIDVHNASVDRDQIAIDSGIGSLTIASGGVTLDSGVSRTTLFSDNFIIDGAISGPSLLNFQNNTRFLSLGLGTGASGSNNLSDTELSRINDGFNQLTFASNDGDLNVGAQSWDDNVALVSSLGTLTIDGVQNVGNNNLTFGARSAIDLNADLIGSGVLTFGGITSNQNIAIGDDAIALGGGDATVDDSSLLHIADGWSEIAFGSQNISFVSAPTRDITFGTASVFEFSDPVTFLGFRDIVINSDLVAAAGSDASFTFDQTSNAVDTVSLNAVIDTSSAAAGGGSVVFRNIDALMFGEDIETAGGDIIIDNSVIATTLTSGVVLDADTGTITIGSGGLAAGNKGLSLRADGFIIDGNISGSRRLLLQTNNGTLGLGTGQVGAANLDDAELSRLQDGFSEITFGSRFDGDVNVGAFTWLDDVVFAASGLRATIINGIQNFGSNDAEIAGDVNVNADLNGTGKLTFDLSDGGIGDNATGQDNLLDDTELGFITDGFNELVFTGNDLILNTNGYEFSDAVTFQGSGDIIINGDLVAAAGSNASFTFDQASNAVDTLSLNAAIDTSSAAAGGGSVVFRNIDALMLGENIETAGGDIIIDNSVTATTLTSGVLLNADSGTITIGSGGLAAGNNSLILRAEDFIIDGNLSGDLQLSFQADNDGTFGVGTGQAGAANLDDAELGRLQDGFSEITFRSRFDGDVHVGAFTWLDDIRFISSGINGLFINGVQNFGSNDAEIIGDVNINAALNGTEKLTFDLSDGGIGDNATGQDNLLDDTELGFITDGFNELVFTGNDLIFNTNGYEFRDPTTILSSLSTNTAISIDGDLTAAAGSDASFTIAGDSAAANRDLDILSINANIDTSAAATNGEIVIGDFINDITLGGNLTTNGANITINDGAATVDLSSNSSLNSGSGTLTLGANGIVGGGNDLSLQGSTVNLGGDVDLTGQTLNVTASAGNINQTAGTLTADSLNLDASATTTADINAQTVDIGSNSITTTLTGLVSAQSNQDGANAITGGPGADVNYTFEGFTIRDVSTIVLPPSAPDTVQIIPDTVEFVSKAEQSFWETGDTSSNALPVMLDAEVEESSSSDEDNAQKTSEQVSLKNIITGRLLRIHPNLANFFGIEMADFSK